MNKKIVLLTFLCLIVFSFNPVSGLIEVPNSGYSHAPFVEGSQIRYYVLSMTGRYNPSSGITSVYTTSYISPIAITTGRMQAPVFFGYDLYEQFYHPLTTPPVPSTPNASQGKVEAMTGSGVLYIGEAINELGNMVIPPEAIITHYPVAGEVIDVYSKVYQSYTDRVVINSSHHWRYKTVGWYSTWAGFNDVWVTSLREYYPNAPDMVYNYAFARDVGIVDYWYGYLNEQNNNVTGWQYYGYDVIEDINE